MSLFPSQKADRIAPNRSHVDAGVEFLGQFQDLDLEAVLDVHQHSLVSPSFLVLLLVRTDEVYRQALGPKTAGTTHSVQVSVSLSREVCVILSFTVVYHQVDTFDVDASSEEVGCHQQTGSVGLEEVVIFDSFFLLQLRVDADRVEQLLSEQFSQFLGPVDSVHEDDHLVEGEGVKQVSQLLELFVLSHQENTSLI